MVRDLKISCLQPHLEDPFIKATSKGGGDNSGPAECQPDTKESNSVPSGSISGRRPHFKKPENPFASSQYRLAPTKEHLIYSIGPKLTLKSIRQTPVSPSVPELGISETTACTFKRHKSAIHLILVSKEGWLACSCSEDSVVLWKWDSLLRNWDCQQIGDDMGRIITGSVSHKGMYIYISLGRFSDIVVIQCIGRRAFDITGVLTLVEISISATIDKLTETHAWLGNVILNDLDLQVVGFSSKNGVSLKVWGEFSNKSSKLKFRCATQLKALATADLFQEDNSADIFYIFAMSSDGFTEVYIGATSSISLLNRVKVEELPPTLACFTRRESQIPDATVTNDRSSMFSDVEFRVLSAKFLYGKVLSSEQPSAESSTDAETVNQSYDFPALDNSLTIAKPLEASGPKLFLVVATIKGIYVVNIQNGELEFHLIFHDSFELDRIMVSDAQISANSASNEITCAISTLFQPSILTFNVRIPVEDCSFNLENSEQQPSAFSLISLDPVGIKSILRKKLKSPTKADIQEAARQKSLGRSQRTSQIHSNFLRPKPSNSASSSRTRSSQCPNQSRHLVPELGVKQPFTPWDTKNSMLEKITKSSSSGDRQLYYDSKKELIFHEKTTVHKNFDTIFPEGPSYLRMSFSTDGNILVTSGNTGPLGIYKTKPKLDVVEMYRDITKVTAVGFSFNSKYLIIATNDCKTAVLNWKLGQKVLLEFGFSSKFNEHINSQFYYMDKFILQPEENRIVLYSYRLQECLTQKLQAGSFLMPFQNITALMAPNQLYSNLIFCGGSNKALSIFDVNAEKVIWTVPNAHSKSITCIRLNEAPKGSNAMVLCDYFLTSSNSWLDPMKLWDLRAAKCMTKIADTVNTGFNPMSRPALSPCGRYIASGFEENALAVYDVRKISSRLATFRGLKSSILDSIFDPNHPMLWAGSKNGLWNFIPLQQ